MKKRRIIVLLMVTCLMIVCCACDEGLRIVNVEIASYPDKLIYVISIDDSLDLDGGTVRLITKDKKAINPIYQMNDERQVNVVHDIDFTREGVYVVKIGGGEYSASFPVQVVSIETLESIINSK